MNKRITFFIGLFFAGLTTMAQDTLVFQSPVSYSFIKNKINVIGNNETLEPFYTRLNELREGAHGVVSILHIGDSHIQADYLTGMTRALLQKAFGNAGLGLIFPGRVARTNESPSIYSTLTGTCTTVDDVAVSSTNSVFATCTGANTINKVNKK